MVRLQKAIAQAGVCSRRKAEHLIVSGHVRVNGNVVTELGFKVDPAVDEIEVDGQRLESEAKTYVMLHKPLGVVTSVGDPQGRPTVVDFVSTDVRLFPVGRLDIDTDGLLLLTNDGELAHRLTHPSFEIEKTYRATLQGSISMQALKQLEQGVQLEDGITWPARVRVVKRSTKTTVILLTIHEGRNRQVRRMADAVGYPVVALRRIQFGGLRLNSLSPGAWRPLTNEEIVSLRRAVGLAN